MNNENDLLQLPGELQAPEDDGGADHLVGMGMPTVTLVSTTGQEISLAAMPGPRSVIYVYPMTGIPGVPLPPGWDAIPGARGCTVESLAFKEHSAVLRDLGASVFGMSTQSSAYQREMSERLHLPFPVLSDAGFLAIDALGLPTMDFRGTRLAKRLTLVVRNNLIEHVLYPVFPPDQAASEVVAWLRARTVND